MRTYTSKRAFTLIELLLVITIILILAALMFPVFGSLKERARRTKCLNNLHQLTIAWLAYAGDNKGDLINHTPGAGGWVGSGADPLCIENGMLFHYASDVKLYRCPTDKSTRKVNYSLSCRVSWDRTYGALPNLSDIKKASGFIVFCEEWDPRWPYGPMGCIGLAAHPSDWWDSPGVWHENGTSFSFADGHAEYWIWENVAYMKKIMGQHSQPILNQRDYDRVSAAYWGN